MKGTTQDGEKIRLLRVQRDLFAAGAVCFLVSIGFALPRAITSYRELKAINVYLANLQGAIVESQQQIRTVQREILRVQLEITKRQKNEHS
jgi:hypothetical protein